MTEERSLEARPVAGRPVAAFDRTDVESAIRAELADTRALLRSETDAARDALRALLSEEHLESPASEARLNGKLLLGT